jgi:hypothetical protein
MHVRSQKRSYISSSIYVTITIDTKYAYDGDFFLSNQQGVRKGHIQFMFNSLNSDGLENPKTENGILWITSQNDSSSYEQYE